MKRYLGWWNGVWRGLALAALLAVGGVEVARGADLPEWLLAAARQPTPALPAGAPALVLLDETIYSIDADGRVVCDHRYAVRVLSRSGSEHARGEVGYLDKRDAVRSTAAWLLRGGKEIRPPTKREWADVTAAAGGAIYDESRSRKISYDDLAFVGDVFGYETRVERRLLFAQIGYSWGASLPMAVERFSLRLAAGWTSAPLLDGAQAAALQITGGPQATTWELRDRPYRPDEPAMADAARVDARLMINLQPPPGAKPPLPIVLRTWAEVADWDLRQKQEQCDSDPALRATVQKLVTACPDSLARIRALSRQVQQLRYVAINKGLGLGFGYRPRKASEVHAKGWGDCKDKANLLCAMLHEVGVEAFMVSANIGGGRQINSEWASMMQFNHAIVAIRVEEAVALPTVQDVPGVGRLLFFDPTDPNTLLGDLPLSLQGSKVQVSAPGNGALTTLAILPVQTNHLYETRVLMDLAVDGTVAGECSFGGPGRAGSGCRGLGLTKSVKELRAKVGELINGTVRGALVEEVVTQDDPATGECRIRFGFTAPRYGQPMAGGLTLVRLDVLSRDSTPVFPEKQRSLPIALHPLVQRDEVTLKLPTGFVVDELPSRTELHSAYGDYESVYEVLEGSVVSRRMFKLDDRTVPVGEYAALRQFLAAVAKADRAALVLRRVSQSSPPAAAPPTAR